MQEIILDDDLLIYSSDKFASTAIDYDNYDFRIWTPAISNMIPPRKPKKYLLFTLFHYLGIFRNPNYCAVLVYDKMAGVDHCIASLLVVPKYYKWPFMAKGDLQFIYVMTNSEYRGRGLATMMMSHVSQLEKYKGKRFWYVTNGWNKASQKTAVKTGFALAGTAIRHTTVFGQKVLTLNKT